MNRSLNISEIFFSLQGEGHRAGTPNIFIRLSGCKAKFACAKSGVNCDTEFESGKSWTIDNLLDFIESISTSCDGGERCMNIIWTGGEPTDQLTAEMVTFFKEKGYFQSIETSGLNPVPDGIDFVVVSPKVAEHIVNKNFPNGCDELRYVRHKGQEIPNPFIKATYKYISPHSDGFDLNRENINHCIELVKRNPSWRLSVQMHKLWNVL